MRRNDGRISVGGADREPGPRDRRAADVWSRELMTTEPTTPPATARLFTLLTLLGGLGGPPLRAQVDAETVDKITHEGREKSQVMAHLDHLVNRIGPRLTGSDNLTVACEWTRDTFAGFGLDA